jgi:hypothetical protein
MNVEVTPLTVFIAILGLLHGYFFFTLTILLARPLSALASEPGGRELTALSRNITHAMAVAFLITMFFSLSLVWFVSFAAGNETPVGDYFRSWALFWFIGILLYCIVIGTGRQESRRP